MEQRTPAIRLGCNTNSYLPMMDNFGAVDEIASYGIQFLEIACEREMGFGQYLLSKEGEGVTSTHFGERQERLREKIKSNDQEVVATCSWVRDNSWDTDPDPAVRRMGLELMNCFTDMARMLGAKRMMTPFGTARGRGFYMSDGDITDSIDQGVRSWFEASRYAAIPNKFGGPLECIEIEQMSYRRDPPSTIDQASYILRMVNTMQGAFDNTPFTPVRLRYDVGHAPARSESDNPDDFTAMGWLRAFPTQIVAFHHKCYLDNEERSVVPMAGDHEERGRVITYDLIGAIEQMNRLRQDAGAPPLDTVDVIIEGCMLKERIGAHKKALEDTKASVKNVMMFLGEKGYKQNEAGLWIKAA